MESVSSDQFVWTCPACARRVPRRVESCRCGFLLADLPVEALVVPEQEIEAQGSTRGALLLVVVIAVAAVAMVPLWWRVVPSPAPAATAPAIEQHAEGVDASVAAFTQTAATVPAITVQPAVPLASAAVAAASPSASLEDVVSRILPAVASIDAGAARGTGFFIRTDQVLTNAHVVQGQSSVRLQVGAASYSARVVNVSAGTDLALLQVSNPNVNQPTVRLGSVGGARPGQEVVAIGSALGVLSNTVTRGIVSAVRQVGTVTLIQTDAAINPGNSGGPLVDRSGMVIGVNSMGFAARTAEGVAFAVAIDHATPLLNGQRSLATQTPLTALSQAMGAPSEIDQIRARGEQQYERVLASAERNANQLDSYWNRYSATCVASSARTGDRPWFAIFEPNGVRINATSAYNCESWLDNLLTNAAPVKQEMENAAEAARQAGVYPGVLRDLRRQHRLQWSGWDR